MRLQVLLRIFIFCSLLTFTGISVGEGELVIHIEKKDPSSSSASDGSIKVSVSGGVAPYRISLISTTLPATTYEGGTIELNGLRTGTYAFTGMDKDNRYLTKIIELQYR